ncbi:MAG TPA: hypothetical protein VH561_13815 [Micromonosporaceae bacterium]|jgi:hypothetical protein
MPEDTADYIQWVVQHRYPDDDQWFDTVDSPLSTLDAARRYRAWYDREVGLPSRIVQMHIRVSVLDH